MPFFCQTYRITKWNDPKTHTGSASTSHTDARASCIVYWLNFSLYFCIGLFKLHFVMGKFIVINLFFRTKYRSWHNAHWILAVNNVVRWFFLAKFVISIFQWSSTPKHFECNTKHVLKETSLMLLLFIYLLLPITNRAKTDIVHFQFKYI